MSVHSLSGSMNRGHANSGGFSDRSHGPDHLPPPKSRNGHPSQQNQPRPPPSHPPPGHQLAQRPLALDQIISNQGTLRRDVLRHDESVQAVRQENIMLAEKVQHATNLYRQLLGRVSKTEERMDMENKSMSNILSQAKQVETQLVNQQERLTNKEAQLHIQVQKMHEEMSILRVEREQLKKSNQSLANDVRMLQEKVARQSGTLSTGLSDLKAHLDQKDLEKHQTVTMLFNELREKVDTQEHNMSVFQTQMEGRLETLKLKSSQTDKQQQNDIYHLNTLIREKEALSKADVRKLQENFRDVFEEFSKSLVQKDSKTRQELDGRIEYIERKMGGESKVLEKKFREMETEASSNINNMKKEIMEQIAQINAMQTSKQEKAVIEEDIKQELKLVEKRTKQNKHDIEKVVRAEIQSRISQGDKLSRQVNDIQKDHNEALTLIQDTLGDHKRKNLQAIDETKRDLLKTINEFNTNEVGEDKKKLSTIEQKIEEVEDALDEFARQDERIDMNSERLKQMEMENILAQGDQQTLIDGCHKQIKKVQQEWKDQLEEVVRQIERERNGTPRPTTAVTNLKEQVKQLMNKYDIMPSQVKLVEKKLRYLAEGFEDYKSQQSNINNALSTNAGPSQRQGTPFAIKKDMIERLELRIDNMKIIINVLKDVLTDKINDEHAKNKGERLLKELKRRLDELNLIAQQAEEAEEEGSENEEEEEEEEEEKEKEEEEESEDDAPVGDGKPSPEIDDDHEDEEEETKSKKKPPKGKEKKKEVKEEEEEDDDEEEEDEEDEDEEEGDEEDEEEGEEEDEEEGDEEEEDENEDDEEKAEEDNERPDTARSSVLALALSRENSAVPADLADKRSKDALEGAKKKLAKKNTPASKKPPADKKLGKR